MATQPSFSEPTPLNRPSESSAAGLVTHLFEDVAALFRNEVALAKSELSEAVQDTKRGVGGVAAGGAVAFAGFLALLASAIIGLSYWLAPWLSALIVGAVVALIGWAMLKAAQKKLSASTFRMERTQESLRRDAATVTRREA